MYRLLTNAELDDEIERIRRSIARVITPEGYCDMSRQLACLLEIREHRRLHGPLDCVGLSC